VLLETPQWSLGSQDDSWVKPQGGAGHVPFPKALLAYLQPLVQHHLHLFLQLYLERSQSLDRSLQLRRFPGDNWVITVRLPGDYRAMSE